MQRGWHAYCMARVKAWRRVLTSGSYPCHVSDWIRSRWVRVSEGPLPTSTRRLTALTPSAACSWGLCGVVHARSHECAARESVSERLTNLFDLLAPSLYFL